MQMQHSEFDNRRLQPGIEGGNAASFMPLSPLFHRLVTITIVPSRDLQHWISTVRPGLPIRTRSPLTVRLSSDNAPANRTMVWGPPKVQE